MTVKQNTHWSEIIQGELKTFADYLSQQLSLFYIQCLNEESCFDFSSFIYLLPTGEKAVKLRLICIRNIIEFNQTNDFEEHFRQFYINPHVPLTDTKPLSHFIRFYKNNQRKISQTMYPNTWYDTPPIQLKYSDNSYGSIHFNQYSLAIEDDIIKFTWLIPNSIELLKLIDDYE